MPLIVYMAKWSKAKKKDPPIMVSGQDPKGGAMDLLARHPVPEGETTIIIDPFVSYDPNDKREMFSIKELQNE